MPFMGIGILAFFAILLLLGALVPLVIVLCVRSLRRNRWVVVLASVPLICLLGGIVSAARCNQLEDSLATAVAKGDVAQTKELLDQGVSADATESFDGPRIIFRAIDMHEWEIVKLLIDHGAKGGCQDTEFHTGCAEQTLRDLGQKELADKLQRNGEF